MTTIAFDGRYLAADGRACLATTITGKRVQKIWEFEAVLRGEKTRVVYAGAGRFETIMLIKEWLSTGHDPFDAFNPEAIVPEVDSGDFEAFFITKDGRMFQVEGSLLPFEVESPMTLGSGGLPALGAMSAGKNSVESIYLAMEVDAGTGGQVRAFDTLNWEWIEPDTLREIHPPI